MLTESTIGGQFNFHQSTLEQIVEEISDQEFQLNFLASYEHKTELRECCELAVETMSRAAFVGRKSCADVMGRAMELLRHHHKLDVPKGWLPVMRVLRSTPVPVRGQNRRDMNVTVQTEPSAVVRRFGTTTWEGKPFLVPADELWTHMASALRDIDEECRNVLKTAADQSPELWSLLKTKARTMGVPSCWAKALVFVDSVIEEVGQIVPEALVTIRDRLEVRCENYWPPGMKPRIRKESLSVRLPKVPDGRLG